MTETKFKKAKEFLATHPEMDIDEAISYLDMQMQKLKD